MLKIAKLPTLILFDGHKELLRVDDLVDFFKSETLEQFVEIHQNQSEVLSYNPNAQIDFKPVQEVGNEQDETIEADVTVPHSPSALSGEE